MEKDWSDRCYRKQKLKTNKYKKCYRRRSYRQDSDRSSISGDDFSIQGEDNEDVPRSSTPVPFYEHD